VDKYTPLKNKERKEEPLIKFEILISYYIGQNLEYDSSKFYS